MSNLTIAVADDLIRRARIRAIEQGTSLSAKVRGFLEQYVDGSVDILDRDRTATERLMATIETATAQTHPIGRRSPPTKAKSRSLRDELYAPDFRAAARKTGSGR